MYCVGCGKEIPDQTTFCPSCGVAQNTSGAAGVKETAAAPAPAVKKAPYNTMCIIGLVVSCISLLLNFWGLVGIAGTILSVLGLTDCQKKSENGRAAAVVGIIIGGFSIIYGFLAILSLV